MFVIVSNQPEAVLDWFQRQLTVESQQKIADAEYQIRLENQLPLFLKFVAAEQFAIQLHAATGSAAHVALVQQALAQQGLTTRR